MFISGKASCAKDLCYAFTSGTCDIEDEQELLQAYYEELSKQLTIINNNNNNTNNNTTRHIPPPMHLLQTSLLLAYADLGRFMTGWGWWGSDIRDKVSNVTTSITCNDRHLYPSVYINTYKYFIMKISKVLDILDGGTVLASEDAYIDAMKTKFSINQ